MSHPHGTYLGGVRTVECLRQRSFVDEITGCWHWRLSCSDGYARVYIQHPETGKKYRSTGPNAALVLKTGKAVPNGKRAYRTCDELLCVNPDHFRAMTRIEHGAWVAKRGDWKGQPNRVAANQNNRRKSAKLTIEKAREIRASEATQAALATQYGVPQSTIWQVKHGHLWKESAGSVFGWRP